MTCRGSTVLAGEWVTVDTRLIEALADALRGRRSTLGLFDPTILPALAAVGYDRSFELLAAGATGDAARRLAGRRANRRRSRSGHASRPAPIDLGGIGKGFAATRALAAMRKVWPALTGAIVDLGGDIGVWGNPPEDGPGAVRHRRPARQGESLEDARAVSGGVATSGCDTRRFGPGRSLHHLIDPRQARLPVGPLAVTVVAGSATEAEVYATALGISTVHGARDLLAPRPDAAAPLVPRVGEPVAIGALPLAPARPRQRLVVNTQVGRFPWH